MPRWQEQWPCPGFRREREREETEFVSTRGSIWAEQVQATQPDWLSPLATTSGRLKQEFRYDIWDQPASGGNRNYQFGGNKGLELITSSRTQILIGVPTYTLVSPSGPPAGFGDLPLMLKFRICFGGAHGRQLFGDVLTWLQLRRRVRIGMAQAKQWSRQRWRLAKAGDGLTCSRPWASICLQETRPSWVDNCCGTRHSNIGRHGNSGPNWKRTPRSTQRANMRARRKCS